MPEAFENSRTGLTGYTDHYCNYARLNNVLIRLLSTWLLLASNNSIQLLGMLDKYEVFKSHVRYSTFTNTEQVSQIIISIVNTKESQI